MQRPATRQSRAANAEEKQHMSWLKNRGICAACGNDNGVIIHHCGGSAYKVKVCGVTEIIGHAFVLGLCQVCDNLVTHGSRRALTDAFDMQRFMWREQYSHSPVKFPDAVVTGIMTCGL